MVYGVFSPESSYNMNTLKRVKMIAQEYGKKVVQVRDSSSSPNEVSIDRIYMYHSFIFCLFLIVSGTVMLETEVMCYNKQFMIMVIKRLRKRLSEDSYILKLF